MRDAKCEMRNARFSFRISHFASRISHYIEDCMGRVGELSALFLLLLAAAGCAKTGDPHPPVLLIPSPTTDLSVVQTGSEAIVSVSMPTRNTNGSEVTTLASVELWRVTEDGCSVHAPLPEDEFLARATRVVSVTAGASPAKVQAGRLTVTDPLAVSDPASIYTSGFRYAARFVNKKGQAAGLTNQAFLAPVPIPPAPSGLSATVLEDSIQIRWAAADGKVAGYNVFKATDPRSLPPAPVNKEPLTAPEYVDRDFQFDVAGYYQVNVVVSHDNPRAESQRSAVLEVIPKDTIPPGPPQNLNAIPDKGVAVLLWGPAPQRDVAGYRIYRTDGKTKTQLSQQLVVELSYRDTTIEAGAKYTYLVTAVDTHGNEGPPAQAQVEAPN
jgi:hypothetical protein